VRHKRRRFRLVIDLENAAFEGPTGLLEVAGVLEATASELRSGELGGTCREVNGNTVGNYGIYREVVD
jgi:hypothetical protein